MQNVLVLIGFASATMVTTGADSWYNALQVNVINSFLHYDLRSHRQCAASTLASSFAWKQT